MNNITEEQKSLEMEGDVFSEKEFNLLQCVANEYLNVINSEKVDDVSLGEQSDAWHNITVKFNKSNENGSSRKEKELQSFWKQHVSKNLPNHTPNDEQVDKVTFEKPLSNDFRQVQLKRLEETRQRRHFRGRHERKRNKPLNSKAEKLQYEIEQHRVILDLKEIKHKIERFRLLN